MDWMKISSALFLLAMIIYLFPRAKQVVQNTPKGSAKDWLGYIVPMAAVVLFVIILINIIFKPTAFPFFIGQFLTQRTYYHTWIYRVVEPVKIKHRHLLKLFFFLQADSDSIIRQHGPELVRDFTLKP